MHQHKEAMLIRADASAQIGTGHVMRCLALAQAWQDSGGRVTFLMMPDAPSLEERIVSEGMEIIPMLSRAGSGDDADQTTKLAQKVGASWVVLDGYHFDSVYQRFIKEAGLSLVFIDDNGHANHYYADFVVNQNLHADESCYARREPYTKLLLGTRYSLLRREFLKWRGWKREIRRAARKVLVTLGGGDPDNVTLKVIQALQHVKMDGLKTVAVVGGSNPHYQELQSAARKSRMTIRLESNVTKMPEVMRWADLAISAAGITAWELAFMGLPSLLLVQADNQRETAQRLDDLGLARNLGRSDLSSDEITRELVNLLIAAERRTEMATRGRQLVDGNGGARVLMHLKTDMLRIRKIREDDCKMCWQWANDADVRAVSFSSDPISWKKHIEWFRSKLNNPACIFYIATNGSEVPLGQIRFELKDDEAVVSISLDREFRGKGYGSPLIWRSAQELFDSTAVTSIHAYVKQANETSVRAFEKAGYRKLERTSVEGHEAVHLVLSRSGKDAS